MGYTPPPSGLNAFEFLAAATEEAQTAQAATRVSPILDRLVEQAARRESEAGIDWLLPRPLDGLRDDGRRDNDVAFGDATVDASSLAQWHQNVNDWILAGLDQDEACARADQGLGPPEVAQVS